MYLNEPTKSGQKREEAKKFFKTLHEFFEIIAPNVSTGPTAVFWALVERSNYLGAHFNHFFWCTDTWLMERLNIESGTTIARYINELVKVKAIFCRRGKHKGVASYYYIPYPYNPKRRDNPMKIIEHREKAKKQAQQQVKELIKQEKNESP